MSKLKTNAIENVAGDKTVTLDQLHSFVGVQTSLRNKIINGNFAIWQRAISQTSAGYGSDDRWNNGNAGTTKVHSLQIATDTERALFNSNFFSRTVVTSVAGTSNYCGKFQAIEDVTKLAGKTVTVSFWAKADAPKNIAIEIFRMFGFGGTPSADETSIGSQLVALTTTWTKYSITITIPSIIGKTLGTEGVHTSYTALNFWFEAGSTHDARTASLGQQSGTFDIAEVQFEEGSVATPFEQRDIGLEEMLCKRYGFPLGRDLYGITGAHPYFGARASANISVFAIPLTTPLRATPTLVNNVGTVGIRDGTGSDSGATIVSVGGISPNTLLLNVSTTLVPNAVTAHSLFFNTSSGVFISSEL